MSDIERPEAGDHLADADSEAPDPVPASAEMAAPPTRRGPSRRMWLAAIAGVLVLPIAVAAALTISVGSDDPTARAASARVVTAAVMEAEFGIKIDLVAVTASGGLIDLRFTVVDKDKAVKVLHDATTMPSLLVEDSGTVVNVRKGMHHRLTLLDGARYFILYSNPGGAIQRGSPVSVVIGDIRLAALSAQT
jgi:hypothetical protein